MCCRVALVKVRVDHVIVHQKVDKRCRPVPRVKQMTAISKCTATRTIDYFDVERLSCGPERLARQRGLECTVATIVRNGDVCWLDCRMIRGGQQLGQYFGLKAGTPVVIFTEEPGSY